MPNEQEEFLKDLEREQETVFEQVPEQETAPVTEPEKESEEEKFNRRERRLQAKLKAERESSIALAAKLEVLTAAKSLTSENQAADYLTKVERIYGTDSPEAVAATDLLKNAFQDVEKRSTERALELFREEQRNERDSVANEEQVLDNMIDEIEDENSLSVDAPTKKAFFSLLEKLSPKDSDGNVTQYADHRAVWEELQSRRRPVDTRAKDLAARSMVKTGASPSTSVEDEHICDSLKRTTLSKNNR